VKKSANLRSFRRFKNPGREKLGPLAALVLFCGILLKAKLSKRHTALDPMKLSQEWRSTLTGQMRRTSKGQSPRFKMTMSLVKKAA
jgi:hypothetical protein